jgi:DNA polymerase I
MPTLKQPKPVTIDYETFGIEARPHYPPVPVGVSIKWPGKQSKYLSWGHLNGNTSTYEEARAELVKAYSHKDGLLFQNGKFDIDVADVHMGLDLPEWQRIHDTMYLLYLDDPHQTEMGLKPSAKRLLGLEQDELDELGAWLILNQPVPDVKISRSKSSDYYYMKYLPYAPAELVGKYANGDVDRTYQLFELLWPRIRDRKMLEAYDRERRLMPILLDMERQGVPVDLAKLKSDVEAYGKLQTLIDVWIIKKIKAPEDINLNSADQLIKSMMQVDLIDLNQMPRTAGGKISTSKESLGVGVTDQALLGMLKYRTQLNTCLQTFMRPWLKQAIVSNGLIYTNWNQIKSTESGGAVGTKTGRLSSTPNFQNMPKEFDAIFRHENPENRSLPIAPVKGLLPLPKCRSYIAPPKGYVFIDRDFSQQEPRILAHFDGGQLMEKYLENPWIDFHDFAQAELAKMGKIYDRKPVKNTNLGLIYGMGAPKLAAKNDMSVDEAKELKAAILKLYPGLKEMYADMKARSKAGLPVRTWGGREYFCEPPKMVNGRMMHFDYKMVNCVIQGSAGDCTKEAVIRYAEAIKNDPKASKDRMLLNVHDQLLAMCPISRMKPAMAMLKQAMESIEFDVPMLSDGDVSIENWDALLKYDKKGVQMNPKVGGR